MYERLQIVAFPASYGKNVFAYSFKETFDKDGWLIYDAVNELKRLVSLFFYFLQYIMDLILKVTVYN